MLNIILNWMYFILAAVSFAVVWFWFGYQSAKCKYKSKYEFSIAMGKARNAFLDVKAAFAIKQKNKYREECIRLETILKNRKETEKKQKEIKLDKKKLK